MSFCKIFGLGGFCLRVSGAKKTLHFLTLVPGWQKVQSLGAKAKGKWGESDADTNQKNGRADFLDLNRFCCVLGLGSLGSGCSAFFGRGPQQSHRIYGV